MTVQNTAYRADYTGNGSTKTFTVPFYFFDNTHLRVILVDNSVSPAVSTDLVLNSDYSVSGAADPLGGSITTLATSAYSSSYDLVILRDVPYNQETHYVEGDPFPAASHERALDLLTMQNQQQQEQLDRGIQFPAGSAAPTPVPGYAIGYDADGNVAMVPNTGADQTAYNQATFTAKTDLAASTGAGLVGFSFSNTYAPGTLGKKAASIPDVANGSLFALKRSLDDGRSCAMQILTDSTGNDTTDWPYILGQQIAADYPGFTVDHMLWSDATQTYAAPTRLQLGTAGERYLDCASGTYATYIDPATSVGPSTNTTPIDVRAKVSLSNWVPGARQHVIVLDSGAAPNIGWRFYVDSDGKLGFLWSTDGTAAFAVASTVTTGFAANAIRWVRVLFNPNDGGGNRATKFYTSTDGATWTQLGTTVTTVGATTVNNPLPSFGYWIGGLNNGPATLTKVYAVDVRDGDTGPSIVPILPDLWGPYSLGTPQQMVGAPILTIVCGAHPGANIAYLGNATRLPKMVPQYGQLVTFLSDSHNDSYLLGSAWATTYKTWVDSVRTKLPGSGICLMTQNPQTSAAIGNRMHASRRYNILALKSAGYDVLDIWQQFIDAGFPGSLMADSVHPNTAGSTLWATYVKKRIDLALG